MNKVGTTIKRLEILKKDRRPDCNNRIRTFYYCHCLDCNNHKWIRADQISNGQSNCGCKIESQFKPIDIADRKFGKLTARFPTEERASNGSVIWKCECDCGNPDLIKVSTADLLHEKICSCGCLAQANSIKFGKIIGELTKKQCVDGTNIRNLTAKKAKNNTSGYKGVSWKKKRSKWYAQIVFKGKTYHLGAYDNKEDAIEARKNAEKKLFGEFLEQYSKDAPVE